MGTKKAMEALLAVRAYSTRDTMDSEEEDAVLAKVDAAIAEMEAEEAASAGTDHTPEPWTFNWLNWRRREGDIRITADNNRAGAPLEEADSVAMIPGPQSFQTHRMGADAVARWNARREANAARIVGCVNACRGMEDPGAVADLLDLARAVAEGAADPRELAGVAHRALERAGTGRHRG